MITKLEGKRKKPPGKPLPEPAERKRIRTVYGVSIQAVADVIGVSRMSVSMWERGSTEPVGDNAIKYGQLLTEMAEAIKQEGTTNEQS